MSVKGAQARITQVVTSWGLLPRIALWCGVCDWKREVGHIHGDHMVDIPFPKKVRDGLPTDTGAIGGMKSEQAKCREAADVLIKAAKDWQGGDASARLEVGWAASEYTSTLRQHLNRLKNLVFPLLEQNISFEDEHKILEGLNNITFENNLQGQDDDKFTKLIATLEDELSDWK